MKRDQLTIWAELNYTTWRLAKMNLAIRGIEANLGHKQADTFHENLHPDLRADFVITNPPFNIPDWEERLEEDVRWKYGIPPKGNANFFVGFNILFITFHQRNCGICIG